jgi:dTDP-4-amino-4,6-dideoxygalactose transaminase
MVISYGKQSVDKSDKLTVLKSFNQLNLTSGKYLNLFEKKLKIYLGCKYVLACSSGTSSIFLALKSLELKKNDIVIMPIVNFIASANISKLLGFKIFFADIDAITGQMTNETLEKCIQQNKLKKIQAVITMHMAGHPYNIVNFYKLKNKYNFKLIEDACHALGSEYKKKKIFKIGSCKHSDISTFSFHPLKTITTGEGGCLATNNKLIYDKAKNLRSHGFETNKNKPHWNYDLIQSSLNFRLSEINCALGFSQMQKINKFLNKRRIIAKNYYKLFNEDVFLKKYVNTPNILNKHIKSAWHQKI